MCANCATLLYKISQIRQASHSIQSQLTLSLQHQLSQWRGHMGMVELIHVDRGQHGEHTGLQASNNTSNTSAHMAPGCSHCSMTRSELGRHPAAKVGPLMCECTKHDCNSEMGLACTRCVVLRDMEQCSTQPGHMGCIRISPHKVQCSWLQLMCWQTSILPAISLLGGGCFMCVYLALAHMFTLAAHISISKPMPSPPAHAQPCTCHLALQAHLTPAFKF